MHFLSINCSLNVLVCHLIKKSIQVNCVAALPWQIFNLVTNEGPHLPSFLFDIHFVCPRFARPAFVNVCSTSQAFFSLSAIQLGTALTFKECLFWLNIAALPRVCERVYVCLHRVTERVVAGLKLLVNM